MTGGNPGGGATGIDGLTDIADPGNDKEAGRLRLSGARTGS